MNSKRTQLLTEVSKSISYPDRCAFYVDTNDLIDIKMCNIIIDNFDMAVINRLNEIIKEITFFIGKGQEVEGSKGIVRFPTYEYNLNDKILTFYLSQIFNLGFESWTSIPHSSLKRYIWESFFHEFIMALMNIMRVDLSLFEIARKYYFNPRTKRSKDFTAKLFNYRGDEVPKVNYIFLMTKLWNETLPYMSFFEVLYNAKIKEIKSRKAQVLVNINPVRVLNELRRDQLNYEYEYNLSELVNYVLNKDNIKIYYKYNPGNRNKLYAKARRIILNFFKRYEIELKEYKDSANHIHLFLNHKVFEKVKSVCYQLCLEKFSNKDMIDYMKFRDFYKKCPICNERDINIKHCESFFFSDKYRYFREILVDKMNSGVSFESLNDNKHYFGIPCTECFSITKNIQGKYQKLNKIQDFILNFNKCPICSAKNHITYLTSFYYDESKKEMRKYLLQNMTVKQNQNFKINIGIPCCICYKQVFAGEIPS